MAHEDDNTHLALIVFWHISKRFHIFNHLIFTLIKIQVTLELHSLIIPKLKYFVFKGSCCIKCYIFKLNKESCVS